MEYLSHGNDDRESENLGYVRDEINEDDKSHNTKEFLDLYCTNLNVKASQLKIDPVIGREMKLREQSIYFPEEIRITPFL